MRKKPQIEYALNPRLLIELSSKPSNKTVGKHKKVSACYTYIKGVFTLNLSSHAIGDEYHKGNCQIGAF